MRTSLPQPPDVRLARLAGAAARLTGGEVTSLEFIGGGRNSQVYRIMAEGGRTYALKVYFRHPRDARDRLGNEFNSLRFLWDRGTREIPQAIAADPEEGCALYEYIDGEKIASSAVTENDLEAAICFLARLRDLGRHTEPGRFPPASEACFSLQAIVENIQWRLDRLTADQGAREDSDPAFHAFLAEELIPAFHAVVLWCRSGLDRAGMAFEQELELGKRTLSPSDFGFHNALRRPDGGVVFLDFEYFGWDDPAKMIADFLLHPAMTLSESFGRRFVAGVLGRFAHDPVLAERLMCVYPLFGLKWCLILLNEFLPEHLVRRRFAGAGVGDRRAVQMAQLSKARGMLQRILREYEHFPYHD